MANYPEHANFHCLVSRLRLQGVLISKTAIRVGSGGGSALDVGDLPLMRDGDGYPFIPGSSLKGVVRSTVEAVIRGAGGDRGENHIWSCDPLAEEAVDGELTCGRHRSGDDARNQALRQPHCSVCQLFGSRVIASHVRFTDAMLLDAGNGRIPIELRDGVAIDRDLRTARSGQKFNFEVVAPGTQFGLEVFVENPEDWLMGILMMGFDQLAEGFSAIGGFTSRGLGRVTLQWQSLTRFDAATILAGGEPQILQASELEGEFVRWRTALAERFKGGR